jgi:hypothetical protein
LQHHVAEPDFDAWENIDWEALSLGHDTLNDVECAGTGGNGNGATASSATGMSGETPYEFGYGYGFVCMHPTLFVYFPQGMQIPADIPADILADRC